MSDLVTPDFVSQQSGGAKRKPAAKKKKPAAKTKPAAKKKPVAKRGGGFASDLAKLAVPLALIAAREGVHAISSRSSAKKKPAASTAAKKPASAASKKKKSVAGSRPRRRMSGGNDDAVWPDVPATMTGGYLAGADKTMKNAMVGGFFADDKPSASAKPGEMLGGGYDRIFGSKGKGIGKGMMGGYFYDDALMETAPAMSGGFFKHDHKKHAAAGHHGGFFAPPKKGSSNAGLSSKGHHGGAAANAALGKNAAISQVFSEMARDIARIVNAGQTV